MPGKLCSAKRCWGCPVKRSSIPVEREVGGQECHSGPSRFAAPRNRSFKLIIQSRPLRGDEFKGADVANVSKAFMHKLTVLAKINPDCLSLRPQPNRRRRTVHDAGEQAVVGGVSGIFAGEGVAVGGEGGV